MENSIFHWTIKIPEKNKISRVLPLRSVNMESETFTNLSLSRLCPHIVVQHSTALHQVQLHLRFAENLHILCRVYLTLHAMKFSILLPLGKYFRRLLNIFQFLSTALNCRVDEDQKVSRSWKAKKEFARNLFFSP